ncbi:hypothetical protein MTO96_036669 [Rhipicephalus appendiculatus]
MTPNASLEQVISTTSKHKVTAAVILPWNLQHLVGEMQRTNQRIKGLRCVSTGGTTLTKPQYDAAREAFGSELECLANVYGNDRSLVLAVLSVTKGGPLASISDFRHQ